MHVRLNLLLPVLLAMACMATIPEVVMAQGRGGSGGRPSGEGQPQGGGRGGFGGQPGGGRGQPGGGRGGFGGAPGGQAPGGGRGGFGGAPGQPTRGGFGGGGGMTEMLKRFDTNGNGVLDPSEQSQGPVGFMLQRMQQSNPKIVPGKPIKIADLGKAIEQARTNRSSGGGSPATPESNAVEIKPLVMGFGSDEEPTPILGFGAGAEQFAIQVTEADRVEARRNMSRYDRNRDSVLDEGELRRGNWREPALMTDRNGDGKLSLSELELRYAMRRDSTASTAKSTATNNRQDPNARGGTRTRGAPNNTTAASKSKTKSKPKVKSYRVASAGDRIAEMKLQDWFIRDDANQDGQIQMSEFSSSWSDKTAEDFAQFDKNNDGVITPQEAEAGEESGIVRGVVTSSSSSDRYASRSRETRGREPSTKPEPRSGNSGSREASSSASTSKPATPALSKAPRNISSAYITFAVKLIKKYDRNSDGVLEAVEWKASSKDYSGADTDGDGKLTPQELAVALTKS